MRKYLLPSALVLALSAAIAFAQTYTRSIQQSQDLTGAFLVDTNLGLYFPGHLLSTGSNRPAPTISGNGSPTISGTDTAGLVTMGTSGNQAFITFGQPYLSVPVCSVDWQTNVTTMTYTLATNQISIGQTATSGNKINYLCLSAS